jgi:SAM-dependent methyltransferase
VNLADIIKRKPEREKGVRIWDFSESHLLYRTKQQAFDFLRFRHKVEGRRIIHETFFLEDNARLIEKLGTYRLVDFGCGDGLEADIALSRLDGITSYWPLDASPHMLKLAEERISMHVPCYPTLANFKDLPEALPQADMPTLAFFLGCTFGNFPTATAQQLLSSMADSLKSGDIFMLGYLPPQKSAYKKWFEVSENKMYSTLIKLFDLDPERLVLKSRYHNGMYQMGFEVTAPMQAVTKGASIMLRPRDIILVGYCRSYEQAQVREMLGEKFNILAAEHSITGIVLGEKI